MTFVHTCKPGSERFLDRELAASGHQALESGPGWLRSQAEGNDLAAADLCFPIVTLSAPTSIQATSVNRLAEEVASFFATAFRDVRVEAEWPVLFLAADVEGLSPWARTVEKEWQARMRGRMSRVFKLAFSGLPRNPGPATGLCAFLTAFDRIEVSCRFRHWGQRRMRDDDKAPSRSYLKVEEAYGILGAEPQAGEWVADLGAAPGGWTYSAVRRGAHVVAVDNGPLKGVVAGHPLVEHRTEDAFLFRPPPQRDFDWLFADIIENPYRVLERLELWVTNAWCRRFIVNIKFGHHDPLALLERIRAPGSVLATRCRRLCARQLLHDREEFTLVGELAGR